MICDAYCEEKGVHLNRIALKQFRKPPDGD